MATIKNDDKFYMYNELIDQDGILIEELNKIAYMYDKFMDSDIIHFYVDVDDKNVKKLYYANYNDDINKDGYIFIDKIMKLNLKNEVNLTDFFKRIEAKLNERRDAHCS